eukprot:1225308-Alexandrium_andersonii.AAC.1
MGPPIRLARSRWAAPLLKQLVYLDDRSFFTGDWIVADQVEQAWSEFEVISGLRTNAGKTQRWGRTPAAARALEAAGRPVEQLGVILGATL